MLLWNSKNKSNKESSKPGTKNCLFVVLGHLNFDAKIHPRGTTYFLHSFISLQCMCTDLIDTNLHMQYFLQTHFYEKYIIFTSLSFHSNILIQNGNELLLRRKF